MRTRAHVVATSMVVALLAVAVGACGDDEADGREVRASGWVEARTFDVVSPSAGRVLAVAASEGDRVRRGEVLVTLDSEAIDAQIEAAAAAADMALAERDRAASAPRPEEVAIAEALLSAALAKWDGARAAFEAASEAPAGLVTATESALATRPDAEAALLQSEAEVEAAQARLDGLLAEPDADVVRAADAAVMQAVAALEALEAQRERLTLRSGVDGVVAMRAIEPGELARPGAVAMRVADLSQARVVIYVPEADAGRLETGDRATIEVPAYPEETFEGSVTRIANRAEFTPRNAQSDDERSQQVFAVEVTVDNLDERLRPGMTGDVTISASSRR